MLTLTLALLLTADSDGGCEWKAPKEPGKLVATVFGGVEFKIASDPRWFRCAKQAGGKLEMVMSIGEGGELVPQTPKPLATYNTREELGPRQLCTTPGLKQIQVTVKGTGEMEKLDWSSSVVEVFCPKCEWRNTDNSLALFVVPRLDNKTPKGTMTMEAGFDPKWFECAKKGSDLELHFFTGETVDEVKKATKPDHIVKGMGGPKVDKTFPKAAICKGNPKFIRYEFSGSGEFRVLPATTQNIRDGSFCK